MFDYQRMFHTGFLVPDLGQAMELYGKALNLDWAEPFTFEEIGLWTPSDGLNTIRLEVVYSSQGPQHVEMLTGSKGSFYDPALHDGLHTGFWSEDLVSEVDALIEQGWVVQAAGAPPKGGWGGFVYLRPPGGGAMIELATTAIRPAFENWWAGKGLPG